MVHDEGGVETTGPLDQVEPVERVPRPVVGVSYVLVREGPTKDVSNEIKKNPWCLKKEDRHYRKLSMHRHTLGNVIRW